jgi:hypothetical protein
MGGRRVWGDHREPARGARQRSWTLQTQEGSSTASPVAILWTNLGTPSGTAVAALGRRSGQGSENRSAVVYNPLIFLQSRRQRLRCAASSEGAATW